MRCDASDILADGVLCSELFQPPDTPPEGQDQKFWLQQSECQSHACSELAYLGLAVRRRSCRRESHRLRWNPADIVFGRSWLELYDCIALSSHEDTPKIQNSRTRSSNASSRLGLSLNVINASVMSSHLAYFGERAWAR